MIYITQIIYIKDGQESVFHQFEKLAISIISNYNGRILLRIRPDDASVIEKNIEKPYEVHIVSFDNEQDFESFKQDKTRQEFLHLKEQSIQSVLSIQGK